MDKNNIEKVSFYSFIFSLTPSPYFSVPFLHFGAFFSSHLYFSPYHRFAFPFSQLRYLLQCYFVWFVKFEFKIETHKKQKSANKPTINNYSLLSSIDSCFNWFKITLKSCSTILIIIAEQLVEEYIILVNKKFNFY